MFTLGYAQVPPQVTLREYWIRHVPALTDHLAWKSFIREVEEEGDVILELWAEHGFRVIHPDFPGDQIIYVRIPLDKLEFFTLNCPIQVKPTWVID